MPTILDECAQCLKGIRSQLITCVGGEIVVYVSVVYIRVPLSNVGNRRPRNLYRRWSEQLFEGGQFHAWSCGRPVVESGSVGREVAMTGALMGSAPLEDPTFHACTNWSALVNRRNLTPLLYVRADRGLFGYDIQLYAPVINIFRHPS